MKQPDLLADSDKYFLLPDDFQTLFERNIFAAIFNLYQNGATRINVVDVDNYLQNIMGAYSIFQKENGIEYLNDCEELSNLANFDYYYTKLKKLNCLRDLRKMGFSTNEIYSDEITEEARKINEKFEELSVSDIIDICKRNISNIENKYNSKYTNTESRAGDNIDELIEQYRVSPEVGANLPGDIFNTIVRGARKGKLYLKSAASGAGKAIPNYTIIPTPLGKRKVDEIQVGDYLFDALGKPTKVLGVYPQGEKVIYEVTFKDGRIAECCSEHLWSFCTSDTNNRVFQTLTTAELSKMRGKRILIPINHAVEYETKEFGIDSYRVGLSLENSCYESFVHFYKYLQGDISQREAFLNGILDSGCCIRENGVIYYRTYNRGIYENISELCYSLGYEVSVNRETATRYGVYIKKDNPMQFNEIISIRQTKRATEMTCFYVDNEEHLFLMNDFIATHNTRGYVGDACALAYPIRYDSFSCQWVQSGDNQKILYIVTEQEESEIQTLILAYLADINEEKILYNTCTEDESKRLGQAAQIMKQYLDNFYIIKMSDPNIAEIKAKIRKYYFEENIEAFFYDYIFSSPGLLSEFRDLKIREDVVLNMLSTALKDLASDLGIFGESGTQLNASDNDGKIGIKNQNNLRGAKSIADKCDVGAIFARTVPDEIEALEPFILKYGRTPNQVLDIYKMRRGRFTNVRIWSYFDYGTCRKYDLFITKGDFTPVEDFSPILFMNSDLDDYDALLDLLNDKDTDNTPPFDLEETKVKEVALEVEPIIPEQPIEVKEEPKEKIKPIAPKPAPKLSEPPRAKVPDVNQVLLEEGVDFF